MATKVVVSIKVLEFKVDEEGDKWVHIGHSVDFGEGPQPSAIPNHWLKLGDTLNLNLKVYSTDLNSVRNSDPS